MTSSYHVFDRSLVKRRRDQAATTMKHSDFLLHEIAEDFSLRLQMILREFPHVLDLGAGNGVIGRKIASLPKIGSVISSDLSQNLVSQCDGLRLVGDEEFLPFAPNSFDLVVSGLSLYSVNDLPGALLQIRQILKPDGLCLLALPGGQTLKELRDAFLRAETEIEGGASPHVAPFVDVRDCGALLQRAGFAMPVTDSDVLTITYDSPFHLMRDIKAMGASNALLARKRKPLRRTTLFKMAEIYQDTFALKNGKIPATFEIIALTGWSPHENQQKPLKPGSAKMKLADALKDISKKND